MRKKYKSNYDYLEEYQKQIDHLDEYETEKLLKEKKISGVYRTDTTKAGEQMHLNIYPAFAAWNTKNRTEKKRKTRESQKRANRIRQERILELELAENFTSDDYWITLTFDNTQLPADEEEAIRKWRNFTRRVNSFRKKHKMEPMKYKAKLEKGEKTGRFHFHAIVDGALGMDEIERLWGHGGRNNMRRLDQDPDTCFAGLAKYLCKESNCQVKKKWFSSKNLRKPKTTSSLTKFSKRKAERMAIDRADLEQMVLEEYPEYKLVNAEVKINPINGGFYIYARMTKRFKEERRLLYLQRKPARKKYEEAVKQKIKESARGKNGKTKRIQGKV